MRNQTQALITNKEIILLLKTVSLILMNLIRLDYDSPADAEKVVNCRRLIFEALFSVLNESYNESQEQPMEVDQEETKEVTIVAQPDSKNKDIRSTNKGLLEFHQLIIEALAFSDTTENIESQFKLFRQIYATVSWEIRLGILRNIDTLFYLVCKSRKSVREIIENNKLLGTFLLYIIDFTKENGEKFDINLMHLSKILKITAESLPNNSEISLKIAENIEQIFDSKIKEDKRNKRREREADTSDIDNKGLIQIKVDNQHELIKQENKILTDIMQNYYLIKKALSS